MDAQITGPGCAGRYATEMFASGSVEGNVSFRGWVTVFPVQSVADPLLINFFWNKDATRRNQ